MTNKRKKKRGGRMKSRVLQHRISVLSISCVIVMLAAVLAVGSISLREKNEKFKLQEAELQEQLQAERERAVEIDELEEYVGTEEYISDVAKEKCGLVYPNEILIKPKS